MVEISKHLFESTCQNLHCHVILHPWNKSCWRSTPSTYADSFIGSSKFYSLIYAAQMLMRGKDMLKKETWIKMGEYYVRSTILGGLVSGTCVTFGCLAWWIMGKKFTYYTYLMIPNMINGLFIYLEPPSRRGLVINLFCNLLIEHWLRLLERAGYVNITRAKLTFMFMLGSSFLFYLMRLEGENEKKRTPLFWLYTPEKVRRKEDGVSNVCPHKGPCQTHVFKGFAKLFGVGAALSLGRILISRIKTPLKAISSIRPQHFKTALFFGSYIGCDMLLVS